MTRPLFNRGISGPAVDAGGGAEGATGAAAAADVAEALLRVLFAGKKRGTLVARAGGTLGSLAGSVGGTASGGSAARTVGSGSSVGRG
jgi:hypothetical protein